MPKPYPKDFRSYLKSKDGLYGSDHSKCKHVIAENLTFITETSSIQRSRSDVFEAVGESATWVAVEGDTVILRQAG